MTQEKTRIKVGISTCLLGQKVRFDGGHKHDRYITDILGEYFEFIPVCPEVAVGMGTPREAVRLQGDVEVPRMVGVRSGKDWTDPMNDYSRKRVKLFRIQPVSGYILKKDSPSCGMERVRVYSTTGMPARNGRGLYAMELIKQYPLLPIEEEGRLNDVKLRENFIVRVFAYDRLQNLFNDSYKRGDLVKFHTVHKYLLLAHSPECYKQLGKLVADIKKHAPAEMRDRYSELFITALTYKTTTRKNVNVLQHILGFLKKHLTDFEKRDILRVIEDYHKEMVPLIVPLTLLRHYLEKYEVAYIRDQVYLNPHPKELMLRNHV
ncbi:MAG: DUF523 and DUF1722 domain-containing protein [candidate division Zixibacteria bacterium]|nr:DUF523 and DUF1722 domain-containing protein [candidate division Zixibacteria bacterium]